MQEDERKATKISLGTNETWVYEGNLIVRLSNSGKKVEGNSKGTQEGEGNPGR
jgi:hypothetical protein